MSGRVALDILDADTNASVLAAFGVDAEKASVPFTVAAGRRRERDVRRRRRRSASGSYAFKVTARRRATSSDGELRPVPVLPGRMHLVQSRFVDAARPRPARR